MSKSIVHFLPWSKRESFSGWIKSVGAFDHIQENDFVGIKLHFGEKGNKGFIRPETVRKVVDHVKLKNANPFLTDANTIYIGQRSDAVRHLRVAADHGFTLDKCGCPIIIADGLRGNSGEDVEVGLKHFSKVSIASAVHYSDSLIFMNHFKGHELTGFGGALKNIGMGCATRAGKYSMHALVRPMTAPEKCTACATCIKWCSAQALTLKDRSITLDPAKCVGCGECILSCASKVFRIPWDGNTSGVQEKIAEHAAGVLKGKRHYSITLLNHVTQFCDCFPSDEEPLMDDIGIFASADPVALDQACADKVNETFGADFFRHIFPEIDWTIQLKYAEQIGLGSRQYSLVE